MPITVGDTVPSIQAPANFRGRRNARLMGPVDHRGRWVALVFYPGAFTLAGATELAELAGLAPAFMDEGTAIMAASTDSWLAHRRWVESEALLSEVSYPVLADASAELARAFGVLAPDGRCRAATFLIDPEGVVRHAAIGGSGGRSAAETLRAVRALRAGAVFPPSWYAEQPHLLAA
jgi:peroxiredoxin (alkyl hydroperoxide reductase subunit C)